MTKEADNVFNGLLNKSFNSGVVMGSSKMRDAIIQLYDKYDGMTKELAESVLNELVKQIEEEFN